MNVEFINDDFMLNSEAARRLYHEYAERMPIYDYHCHLSAGDIASDRRFSNLTEVWLYGDHYKWRAMRTNGVSEKYCTGDADDYEKFCKWAETIPYCLRNPLYHWTHLELARIFGIKDKLLSPDTADKIYRQCNALLGTKEFSVRNILRRMNVRLVCTTDDPLDSLEHHSSIVSAGLETAVYPAWRPDKAMAVDQPPAFNTWADRLAELTNIEINNYGSYLQALNKRHEFFHENGCRLSDHGLGSLYAEEYTGKEIEIIFLKIRSGKSLTYPEQAKFGYALLYDLAVMNNRAGWVQQFHLGTMRNVNSKMYSLHGPDSGFDSIGDFAFAVPLAKFLDKLNAADMLAKTVIYNLNPKENEVFAALAGCFQDGSCPGKIQYGPAWWFLDQTDGMIRQLNALSSMGLLGRFIGMTTDSRSFLSFPRHEYFRRILCNMLGSEIESGLLPGDFELTGQMVRNICFNNAGNYFPMIIKA